MDKELEKLNKGDENNSESKTKQAPQLNPNNDFQTITSATSKLAFGSDSLEKEFEEYEGQISQEEWENITNNIEESSPYYIHKKLTAFWKSMDRRFPRLSKIALQVFIKFKLFLFKLISLLMCQAPHAILRESSPKQLAILWTHAVIGLKMKLFCSHASSEMLKNLKLPLFITARKIILKSKNKLI